MKIIRSILLAVIAVEAAMSCYFVVGRLSRANPPSIDSRRLDPVTAADLQRIRKRAADGVSRDWRELAEAYLGNGYYVAAEQCFRHAADLVPEDRQAQYGRGFCLERIGRTKEAIEVLSETAASAAPELARTCWYQIGRCFLREEKAQEAETAFRKISDFQPAAYQLAKLFIRLDRANEAIPVLEQLLAVMPNSLKLLQLRRHAAEALGDKALVTELRDREDRAEYQLVLEYGQSFISMFAARYGLSKILSG
ncbi:MAG: tetratricopeptide repeat protein, partial [Fuerstiella sp.]